jgi:hypothetical protein
MKPKIIAGYLLLIILFLSSYNSFAQIFKGEVLLGMNKSQVDGDERFRYRKYGLVTGVGVVAPVSKNWAISMETIYNQKGSRQRAFDKSTQEGAYKLRLNYVEVPLLIMYTDKNFASIGAGASWGRLVDVQEYVDGIKVDSVSTLSKVFDKDDFSALIDLRVRVYKNLMLNARYTYSIDKIATRTMIDSESGKPNERDFYNNMWSFRLVYMINEKNTEVVKKKKPVQEY